MADDDFVPVPGVDAEPAEQLLASDPDVLVGVAQPLRSSIARLLIDGPATAAELAEQLDVPLTRLYYHLGKLEELGVIRVVATRRVRGVEERRYRACARDIRLDPDVVARARSEPELLDRVVQALLAGTREEMNGVIGRLGPEDQDRMLLARPQLRLTPERHVELVGRLYELLEEFVHDRGDVRVGVLLAAYPLDPV